MCRSIGAKKSEDTGTDELESLLATGDKQPQNQWLASCGGREDQIYAATNDRLLFNSIMEKYILFILKI